MIRIFLVKLSHWYGTPMTQLISCWRVLLLYKLLSLGNLTWGQISTHKKSEQPVKWRVRKAVLRMIVIPFSLIFFLLLEQINMWKVQDISHMLTFRMPKALVSQWEDTGPYGRCLKSRAISLMVNSKKTKL